MMRVPSISGPRPRLMILALIGSPVFHASCSRTIIILQEPPKPFATLHRALTCCVLADWRKEQHVALTLAIPLMMKMRHVVCQRMVERRFPKEDQPRETLLLDGSHPALRVGVQIWRSRRQWHPRDPGCIDDLLKGRTIFPIPVVDEILAGGQ